MSDQWPKIKSRKTETLSPWVELVTREVEVSPEVSEIYLSVKPQDYLAIVAQTPSGHFPIVRQYRPAIEAFTWELPAGLTEPGEDLAEGCRRELLEETGFRTRTIHSLGTAAPCTGRLSNRIHTFFLETAERVEDFVPEPGMAVKLVTAAELVRMITSGEFISQLHLGALLLAELRSFITLR
ncbi:NUDIX hydrolase [Bradyrhizobium erythrophlei]|uniref:GDP-mannose pyrophosphatase n=1 Tax=Bradyrhizobium erythrophlei TaxID=1437360 RepID=A0A1M7UH42_9BRAD|nr:NUDIX hydrolase [Bradyrhizobium erythrophlei]SHN82309.1 NUDIX domain-containing protein [Bradyrhizobium erythrophlei]